MPYSDPEERREYARKWVAARRAAWFVGKVCIECGSVEQLELDHVNPELKVSHNIWSWSVKRRDEELIKCVIRCFTCHKKKTLANREYVFGEAVKSGVLSEREVLEIRDFYSRETTSQRELASLFGVSQRAISQIIRRKTWTHI